jgi:Na+/proline symporter
MRKYGYLTEVIVSLIEIVSFTCLLAGNLVGTSLIINFCFNLAMWKGILIAGGRSLFLESVKGIPACLPAGTLPSPAWSLPQPPVTPTHPATSRHPPVNETGVLMVTYTMVGGLYSIALTDIPQAILGFMAFICAAIYAVATDPQAHANVSMGFALDLGGNVTAVTPDFAGPLDCAPDKFGNPTCDNYAYPVGDHAVFPGAMTNADAYAPFPNAILLNWATIVVLGLGNLCALDFQQRSMAAKSPRVARAANVSAIGGGKGKGGPHGSAHW